MSMGNSKTKKIIVDGKSKMDRTPAKPLNLFVKAKLLDTLRRNDISIKIFRRAGDDTYTVTDAKGDELFSFDNAWDCGYYNISVGNIIVAEMDWFESDNYTNKYQQDMFDVLKAIQDKQNELRLIKESKQALTAEEIRALKALELQR